MAGVLLLTELLQGSLNDTRCSVRAHQDYISALIHEKAVAADLAFYESSDYHDKLERARSDASTLFNWKIVAASCRTASLF